MTMISEVDVSPPALRQLNRGILVAIGMATAIVTMAVLPAEYGIDPTGIGRVLGLTQMGERKMGEATGSVPAGPVAGDSATDTSDGGKRVQIVIGPYGGREVKAVLKAGATMTYQWSTDGEPVTFEFHGEPDQPNTPGDYSSYEKGRKTSATGTFTAGFAGHHGWFWKNSGPKPMVITAVVAGAVDSFAPIYATGESAAVSTPAVVAGGTADATRYHTDLPLKTLMRDGFERSAQDIWKRQGYISDANGFRSLFPKTEAEWSDARADAVRLAEMTNVLLIPGRRVDEKAWIDSVAAVRKSALALAAFTGKTDDNAYLEAGLGLSEACSSCHQRYAPGVE